MSRSSVRTNRRHWHVLYQTTAGGPWFHAGVRMTPDERWDERDAGRRRSKRRWFTSPSAATKAKRRIEAAGGTAMTVECRNPDWCRHGPPI